MSLRRTFCTAILLVGLPAGAACAAQSWLGTQVMPKSPDVEIQSDTGSPISMDDIAWPATVQKTQGRFLWVQDEGGYSRNQAGGWIYSDDVVKTDEAGQHYSSELRRGETPWLYWMRGISWEANGEPGIAVMDYQSALRVDPRTSLDDVHIRLGRMYAQAQLHNGRGQYNPELRSAWEGEFKAAQNIKPDRPQLFYEWGLALSQACDCSKIKSQSAKEHTASPGETTRGLDLVPGSGMVSSTSPQTEKPASPKTEEPASGDQAGAQPSTAESAGPNRVGSEAAMEALGKFEDAQKFSPNWWRIPLARAEFMLSQCDQELPAGERGVVHGVKPAFFVQLLSNCKKRIVLADDAKLPLLVAMRETPGLTPSDNQASPPGAGALPQYMPSVLATALQNFDEAIRLNPTSAIDAYRDRAEILRVMLQLDEAHQSALTACKLCNYRRSGSLRTLSQINFDLGYYQPAADFALRAAELTSGDEQQRYLRLWTKCGKKCSSAEAQLVANSLKAGYVSAAVLRSAEIEGVPGANGQKEPAHIEPPPGFMSRSSATVD